MSSNLLTRPRTSESPFALVCKTETSNKFGSFVATENKLKSLKKRNRPSASDSNYGANNLASTNGFTTKYSTQVSQAKNL